MTFMCTAESRLSIQAKVALKIPETKSSEVESLQGPKTCIFNSSYKLVSNYVNKS